MQIRNQMKAAFLLMITCLACVDIEGPEMEPLGPGQILSRVEFPTSTVMMVKGDSHRIDLGIYAMNRESIPYNPDSIRWSSAEATVVKVTEAGVLYGLQVSDGPVLVTATYRHKYVTMTDSLSVYVTDGTVDVNKIRLVSLDSSKIDYYAMYGYPRVRVDLFNGDTLVERGAVLPIAVDAPADATIDYTGGPNQEPVYRIRNTKSFIGKFWVRTSVNIYGNVVKDSLEFTGLYGSYIPGPNISDLPEGQAQISTNLDTIPLRLYQPCAYVFLSNTSTDTIDFVFSDSLASPTGCAESTLHPMLSFSFGSEILGQFIGGNFIAMPPKSVATRQSNTVGIITYSVRKSSTKEIIPFFIGHYKQLIPE